MEGLQQEQRHHHRRLPKKPTSNGSRAAEDAFGGGVRAGSRYSNPPKPNDYAEIFGGLASSCSIPVLDLPPARDDGSARNSSLDYFDIFGGFRSGDFGASYEELFPVKTERKESKPPPAPAPASISSSKERFAKEKGTKYQPNLSSESTTKDQTRNNDASIKMDESTNHKGFENSNSFSTKRGSRSFKKEPTNGSMHLDESISVSAVTFSTDLSQVSSSKINYSSIPVTYTSDQVNVVAENNLKHTSSPPTSLQNKINEARDEVMCREKPSFAEMAPIEDNPSNEQYHSCSSSDQSALEVEDITSAQSNTNQSTSYETTDEVTVEISDKAASSSSSSSCATNSHISSKIDQMNITAPSEAPQNATTNHMNITAPSIVPETATTDQINISATSTASQNARTVPMNTTVASKLPQTVTSFEGLQPKDTNDQFQSIKDEKHSAADQSDSTCSQSLDMTQGTTEDMDLTLFRNTKVPECELGQKQSQQVDCVLSDRAANARHPTHSFNSVSSRSEQKYELDKRFLTVVDINLRTVPCKVPPPSRPPPSRPLPKTASIQGHTGATVQMKNIVSGASENSETSKDGQPDVQDATATAASIAVKEAMEHALAKIKVAKEAMERKKDNHQYRKKLGKSQDEEREVVDATTPLDQLIENDRSTESLSCKIDAALSDEKTDATSSNIQTPEFSSAQEVKQSAHEKASGINQVCGMQDENTGTWKIEEQFVELVKKDKSFKKVKEISDSNASQSPEMSVEVVDGKLKDSETYTQMLYENNTKAPLDAPVGMNRNLMEVSESDGLQKNNGGSQEHEVPAQVKKADEYCSSSNYDALTPGFEDMLKEDSSSCVHKENEVPTKDPVVPISKWEIPIPDRDPECRNTTSDDSKSSKDNTFEEIVPKLDFNDEKLDSIHEMCQSNVDNSGINSSETNCKIDTDDVNTKDPEPIVSRENSKEVEVPSISRVRKMDTDDVNIKDPEPIVSRENSKEVEVPSISRVRKKWNIPKFAEGSILATEDAYDQGEKKQAAESEVVSEQDGPKISNENLEACENSFSRKEAKHRYDAVQEHSTGPGTDQQNVVKDEVDWQYFCKKIIKETQDKSDCSGEKQGAAEVHAERKCVEEDELNGQGCNKTGIEGESAFSIQDTNIRQHVVTEASQSAKSDILGDSIKKHSRPCYKSSPEEPIRSQNEEKVKQYLEIYKAGQMQEERVLRDDELKRDAVKKLEEERGRERQRKLQEEREREREREREKKLEEEREREREREKDRQAVERAIRESRERAERAAVERVTAEARQRALAEAREKAEKASAEALLQAEKASREARLRAERAAVERATAEARERASERALAEKTAQEAKERSNNASRDRSKREGGVEGVPKVGSKDEHAVKRSISSSDLREPSHEKLRYSYSSNSVSFATDKVGGNEGESAIRCKARLERHQRTVERAAKALEEKNKRDILAQKEQAERNMYAEVVDAEVRRWSGGKEGNLRALLSTLQYILGPDSGWQSVPLTEIITAAAVKKAYRKATLYVHPDKLQQRGANTRQKYVCEKVFDLLKEAWNRFNSEER